MINKIYLNNEVINDMKRSYEQHGGVLVLNEFLQHKSYEALKRELLNAKGRKVQILDKYRYEVVDSPKIKRLFASNVFKETIGKISSTKCNRIEVKIRRFGHTDYILIHDSAIMNGGIEFFFFVCDEWKRDYGGMKVYVSDKEPLIFLPQRNTFCLVKRGKGMRSFVKYVNHLAKGKSFVMVEGR